MPNTSLSDAIKEAYASAPIDVVIIHTLEFRHPFFVDDAGNPAPIRVVLDHRDWTARLENQAPIDGGQFVNFVGYSFDMTLPDMEESGSPSLQIEIDNVSQQMEAYIASAATSSELTELTYRPYLSNDVDTSGRLLYPQMDPPLTLDISFVKVTPDKIVCTATFGDLSNKRFPVREYVTNEFPGLLR